MDPNSTKNLSGSSQEINNQPHNQSTLHIKTILLNFIIGFFLASVLYLGSVLMAGTFALSGTQPSSIEDFLLLVFGFFLPPIAFFAPNSFYLRRRFSLLLLIPVVLAISISTGFIFYQTQLYFSNKSQQKLQQKLKGSDKLSNQGVSLYSPGYLTGFENNPLKNIEGDYFTITNKQGITGFEVTTTASYKGKKLSAWTFDFLSPQDQISCFKYKDYPLIKLDSSLINKCEDVMIINKSVIYRYSDNKLFQFIMFDKRKTRVAIEFKSEDSNNKLTKEDIIDISSKILQTPY